MCNLAKTLVKKQMCSILSKYIWFNNLRHEDDHFKFI